MRKLHLLWLILPAVLLWTVPAAADSRDDFGLLGRFDIVIGDTGDRYNDWDLSATRVYAQVMDGRVRRDFYFDSLPAAHFVLCERYREPQIVLLDVQEYGYARHPSYYVDQYGLIDGYSAYYVWAYNEYSRGGMPLVLAFSDLGDARDELRYREGKILDYDGMMNAIARWSNAQRSRIYWRGWDYNRWNNDRWNVAWRHRWDGWNWDNDRGWLHLGLNIILGDRDHSYERGEFRSNRHEHNDDYRDHRERNDDYRDRRKYGGEDHRYRSGDEGRDERDNRDDRRGRDERNDGDRDNRHNRDRRNGDDNSQGGSSSGNGSHGSQGNTPPRHTSPAPPPPKAVPDNPPDQRVPPRKVAPSRPHEPQTPEDRGSGKKGDGKDKGKDDKGRDRQKDKDKDRGDNGRHHER